VERLAAKRVAKKVAMLEVSKVERRVGTKVESTAVCSGCQRAVWMDIPRVASLAVRSVALMVGSKAARTVGLTEN
jgi:hypothetical protein